MGFENEAYIVMRVIPGDQFPDKPSDGKYALLSPELQEELGFIVTYVSQEFHKLFLNRREVALEDLVFRKVNASGNPYEQYESSDDEENKSSTQGKSNKKSNNKQFQAWHEAGTELKTLKQIVDQWTPSLLNQEIIYEVKSLS